MYFIIEIFIVICCFGVIFYLAQMHKKYQNDTSMIKETIIHYFNKKQVTDVDSGVRTKALPIYIAKNPFLLMMIKDKTLGFKKGKYY